MGAPPHGRPTKLPTYPDCDPFEITDYLEAEPGLIVYDIRITAPLPGPLALPEPPLPPLATRAANYVKATIRDAKYRRARLDEGAIAARLAVCTRGEGLPPDQTRDGHCDQYRPSDGSCSACGCTLAAVGGKAERPHERCPLRRWPEDRPAE